MKLNWVQVVTVCAATGSALYGQQGSQRNAAIIGGGGPDGGKCTIEVVVDGVAEVELRGTTGVLRNISGQPAQWRRFECSSPLPANPVNFRFAGVDGRGRQNLVRDPRNGGVAVVQIEDQEAGSEGYTFDVTWSGGGGGQYNDGNRPPSVPLSRDNRGDDRAPGYDRGPAYDRGPGYDRDAGEGHYRPDYRDSDYYRRYNHGFETAEAVRVCQIEIQRQAVNRFRRAEVHFENTRIDDGPGRQDWVVGMIDVHRGPRGEQFHFSCSVDFNTGQVRTATLDPAPVGGGYR